MSIKFSQSERFTNWYTWECDPPMSFITAQTAVIKFLSEFKSVEYLGDVNGQHDHFYFKFTNNSDEAYFLLKSSSGITP